MPGGGQMWCRRWRSSSFSIQPISVSRVAGSGRGIPDGGIIPARSFRTIFSASLRMVGEVREIELVEQQVRGLQLLVVADDAVLIEERALRGNIGELVRPARLRPAAARRCGAGRAGVPAGGLRRSRLAGHEHH